MREIRSVLRLHFEAGCSQRAIARSLKISRDAVADYLVRAKVNQLSWPLPPDLNDAELEQLLFSNMVEKSLRKKPEPNFEMIHQELRGKGATLLGLHKEFLQEFPDGIGYSIFCARYRGFKKTLKRYMRQVYYPGERVMVDYAGPTYPIHHIATGEINQAQIFVGVLGASVYTYAEAHWSQKLPDWIAAHVRMFEYFGGVPKIIVCDNLKSGVTKASRIEPIVNATYQSLAEHYNTMVLPARPHEPTDKAKVENMVLTVERWILFRLRKRLFTSLEELNIAIRELLVDLNKRPFQKLAGSRLSVFESVDSPALMPLPSRPYEYIEFRKVRVGLDYCVEIDRCAYSVPSHLCRQQVEVRITSSTIEVLYKGNRVASHVKTSGVSQVIDKEHMPANHRHFGLWDARQALEWAEQVGQHLHDFLVLRLATINTHEQGYRLHNGLKKLAHEYEPERLNKACGTAMRIGATSLNSLRSILKNGLDNKPIVIDEHTEASFNHPNIRGADYYH